MHAATDWDDVLDLAMRVMLPPMGTLWQHADAATRGSLCCASKLLNELTRPLIPRCSVHLLFDERRDVDAVREMISDGGPAGPGCLIETLSLEFTRTWPHYPQRTEAAVRALAAGMGKRLGCLRRLRVLDLNGEVSYAVWADVLTAAPRMHSLEHSHCGVGLRLARAFPNISELLIDCSVVKIIEAWQGLLLEEDDEKCNAKWCLPSVTSLTLLRLSPRAVRAGIEESIARRCPALPPLSQSLATK
jgi:hypothetical protein